jgi:hypothetical protein
MGWPPKIGEVLPRATECWHERVKLEYWVLAARGHGPEWERVFRVGLEDQERVWEAIAAGAAGAQIATVRDRGAEGIVCGIEMELTLGERTAPVTISWHYASEGAAPRLVTAYPTL